MNDHLKREQTVIPGVMVHDQLTGITGEAKCTRYHTNGMIRVEVEHYRDGICHMYLADIDTLVRA